jgi:nicotinate-nucleotide pyrophosphorylase (carboxylating)
VTIITTDDLVDRALAEDVGDGDVTVAATVDPDARGVATITQKAPGVLSGLDVAEAVFLRLDPDAAVERLGPEGEWREAPAPVLRVEGLAGAMLTAERTALNLLQRMSGIATLTRAFVDASRGAITVLDTRKTTPTLRALEKYSVRAGGGANHRSGLDDGILIKDNHIRLAGGVEAALERMRKARHEMPVEIEAQSLDQVDAALAAGADIILLDNLPTGHIREAVRRIGGRAKVEVSGGVTLDRIGELAQTGADYVSVGALTHSAPAADISFELEPDA